MRTILTILSAVTSVMFLVAGMSDAGALSLSRQPATEPRNAAQDSPEVRELALGTTVERELRGGEIHSYKVNLTSGQYLCLIVDQRGVDVVTLVFGPEGKLVAGMDTVTDRYGPEEISVLANATGIYRLEVRALVKEADPGRYAISIKQLRRATSRDETRIAAERALAEGAYLRDQGQRTAEALSSSNKKYEEALTLWRVLGDRQGEAYALLGLGANYSELSDYERELEYLNQALPLLQSGGNRHVENYTLNMLAIPNFHLGDFQKALQFADQALTLSRRIGNPRDEARALDISGMVYLFSGEHQKAQEYFSQALTVRRTAGDRQGGGYTLLGLGVTNWSSGQYELARDQLSDALAQLRSAGDQKYEAVTLQHLGEVFGSLGEHEKARHQLNEALRINHVMGNRQDQARTLYGLARVDRDDGNLTSARTHIEAALAIIESRRSNLSQQLRASYLAINRDHYYAFYIDLLMRLHEREPSKGHDAEALQVSERARARSLLETLAEARADIRQGVDHALLERERSLQQQINARAERLTRMLGGKHTEQHASAAKKELDSLLAEYQQLQAQIRTTSPRYAALTQPQTLSVREIQKQVLDGDTLLLEYALGDKRSYVWAVTPTLISSFELPGRSEIETAARRAYELLKTSHKRESQWAAELAASELSQMVLGPVASQLGKRRLLIVSDGALQYVPFAALPVPYGDTEKGRGGDAEKGRRGDAEKGRGGDTEKGRRGDTEKGRRGDTEKGRRGDTATGETGGSGEAVESSFIAVSPRPPFSVSPPLPVPASPLRPVSPVPLVVNHEIVSLPSASVLAVLRQELAGHEPAPKALAVLADPVFSSNDLRVRQASIGNTRVSHQALATTQGERQRDGELIRSARESGVKDFERLPFTREEAEAIISQARNGDRLKALDFDAGRSTVTNAGLDQYRIVHFATHGLLNSQHPELSGIVLSLVDEEGRPQDGFLRAHEIYNLRLRADLVVLSACQTALGKEIKGEGLAGLTRGFMYAGAARVVASLWDVKDEATAELMKRFYQGMLRKGLRPADALRVAQVSMLTEKRWKAPYYWAGFVLQGEWR